MDGDLPLRKEVRHCFRAWPRLEGQRLDPTLSILLSRGPGRRRKQATTADTGSTPSKRTDPSQTSQQGVPLSSVCFQPKINCLQLDTQLKSSLESTNEVRIPLFSGETCLPTGPPASLGKSPGSRAPGPLDLGQSPLFWGGCGSFWYLLYRLQPFHLPSPRKFLPGPSAPLPSSFSCGGGTH